MTTTDANRDHQADEPATDAVRTAPTLRDRIGGPMGFVYSSLPAVVFSVANGFLPLPVTIAVSVGVAVLLTAFRLWRGERGASAVGGLVGVAVSIGVVVWTGSAKDFFVIGIWLALACFVVASGSVLARRPLTGVIWNAMHGNTNAWRADRPSLRAHDLATLAAAAVFGARFVVQQWLYLNDTTGGLAVARVAMGAPLTILAALVVVRAFRRSSRRLLRTS